MGTSQARRRTIEYDIKGEPYTLTEFSAKDLADFEDFVLNRRVKQIRDMSEGMDESERFRAMGEMIKGGMQGLEVLDEMRTMSGIVFLLHKSLSYQHPDLTIDDVGLLLDLTNSTELSRVLENMGAMADEAEESESDPQTPPEITAEAPGGDSGST